MLWQKNYIYRNLYLIKKSFKVKYHNQSVKGHENVHLSFYFGYFIISSYTTTAFDVSTSVRQIFIKEFFTVSSCQNKPLIIKKTNQ